MTERTAPLRILLLDTGNEWGGGTNSMLELLKRLDGNRHAVTACFYRDYRRGDSSLGEALAEIGVPLRLLPTRAQPLWAKLAKELLRGLLAWHRPWRARAVFAIERLWRIRPRAKALAELIRGGEYDLLYANNQPASNMEAYFAAEVTGVPLVQHCRIDPVLNPEVVRVVNRVARRVICVSRGVADTLVDAGVNSRICQVVNNGIDVHQALPEPESLPVPVGVPILGTIGSLIERKAVDHQLRAIAALPPPLAPHLLIVGAGPQESALRALAVELGLADQVTFAGFQAAPLPWLAAMDVLILSSASEGMPRVILEAMLFAKPVIASRVVGSEELVLDGQTGLLYPYGNVDALRDAIAAMLADADAMNVMGQAGRDRVVAGYSIADYVNGVVRELEAVA